MTELQRLGLITILAGMSEDLMDICHEGGKQLAPDWMTASEEEKQELLVAAKEALEELNKLAEQL